MAAWGIARVNRRVRRFEERLSQRLGKAVKLDGERRALVAEILRRTTGDGGRRVRVVVEG